jgi:hypothetical protein
MPGNARQLADRGVPLGVALQRSLLATVPDLERFIDESCVSEIRRGRPSSLKDWTRP